jgi:D-alanine-D-alanine ligase
MKILVIYGGFGLSSEAEVSKRSGLVVVQACRQLGHDTAEFELNKDNIDLLTEKINSFDLVFPVLHGGFGEDGQIQKILEKLGVQFIGSGSDSSELCFDKVKTKELLEKNNILTPKWRVVTSYEELMDLKMPLIVKPIQGGSSIGMVMATSAEDLQNINFSQPLLAEEYIDGRELTVSILGNIALPVIEIIPAKNRWFNYENKYSGLAEENIPPKFIDEKIQKQAQELALKVHQLCGCRHLSRIDIIFKDDRLYVLEINTMPGMTTESLYPKSAQANGLSIIQLVDKLIKLAV